MSPADIKKIKVGSIIRESRAFNNINQNVPICYINTDYLIQSIYPEEYLTLYYGVSKDQYPTTFCSDSIELQLSHYTLLQEEDEEVIL